MDEFRWERFEALVEDLARTYTRMVTKPAICPPGTRPVREYRELGNLRGAVEESRRNMLLGRSVLMHKNDHSRQCIEVVTPDQFVNAWEGGFRP